MKLIEIIKKHGMLLLAGLAVIGFSSFKMIEKSKLTLEWYEVTPHPTDPNQDEIGSPISDPTQSGNCSLTNTKNRCAIQLDLSKSSQMPETVEEALNDPDVTVGNSTFRSN